jgi:hypothetical protein
MDTLPREDVLPHLTSKVSPQLGRGGFGVEGGEEGVEVSKLGGAEEGTEDCRAGDAIEKIREVYTNTNPGVRGRVRVRVRVRVRIRVWVGDQCRVVLQSGSNRMNQLLCPSLDPYP